MATILPAMRLYHYRMTHRAISCQECLKLHGKDTPTEARDWLKPEGGHAIVLTREGRARACILGAGRGGALASGATVPATELEAEEG